MGAGGELLVTMLGYGSLMSEASARLTTPSLVRFRYVRILNHRRVFGHPTALFFEHGIANVKTLEMSSLSAEPCDGASFCGVAFDVPAAEWEALRKREEVYVLAPAECEPLDGPTNGVGRGMLCTRASDDVLRERGVWPRYEKALAAIPPARHAATCWHWSEDSGLLPCATYLRHCLLSSRRPDVPQAVRESFLDDTFLVDRQTSLRAYLARPGVEERVMASLPPAGLEARYGG